MMERESPLAVARAWQAAANAQRLDHVLARSDPAIELVGPRGTAHGHQALRAWFGRAGLRLTTLRTFAREGTVVMEQRGEWRSPETGELLGEAIVATLWNIAGQRVARLVRYDSLDTALAVAGLSHTDEVCPA